MNYIYTLLITLGVVLFILFFILLRYYIIRRRRCLSKANLHGKIAIVTGSNVGLGKETALNLSQRGAKVILACRDVQKGEYSAAEIRSRTSLEVDVLELDLASLASVREFSRQIHEQESRVDILVNNAGVFRCPYSKTEDGFEMQMGVNHLGHFLLTNLLLDLLKKSTPSRVVCVGSFLYTKGSINFDDFNCEVNFDRTIAYCCSKLANGLFVRELSKRLEGSSVTTYCVNPGIVRTNLLRHSVPVCLTFIQPIIPIFQTAKEGAHSIINCAVSEDVADESGFYYSGCHREQWHPLALDDDVAKRLWELSERLTGLSDMNV